MANIRSLDKRKDMTRAEIDVELMRVINDQIKLLKEYANSRLKGRIPNFASIKATENLDYL